MIRPVSDMAHPLPVNVASRQMRRGTSLRSVVRFPVEFQSFLDGLPFQLASAFVLFYVVAPQLDSSAAMLPKYLFSVAEVVCFAILAVTRPIYLFPLFPLGSLLLFTMGVISLCYSVFIQPGTSTYSSALIPLIVIAMPLLVAPRAARTNHRDIIQYLLFIFSVGSVCHVFWQIVAYVLGWDEDSTYYGSFLAPVLNSTIMQVYLLTAAGLFRRNLLVVLAVGLIGVNEVLRPTSTLAFAALFAMAFIVLQRMGLQRSLRRGCIFVVAAICIANLAILESEFLANAIYSIEPLIKQDTLDASSNNEFRLGVLAAARDEMSQYFILTGKAFTGDVAVDAHYFLQWQIGNGKTIIHSDFVIMIVQGGLIGYGLFCSIFIGMAALCAKAARIAGTKRDVSRETLLDALQAMNVTFMLYISAQPSLPVTQCALPCLILVPLAIFLARSPFRADTRLPGAARAL